MDESLRSRVAAGGAPVSTWEDEGADAASVTTIEDEVNRLEQALLDLRAAEASSVVLTHCPSPKRERDLIRELSSAARGRGFVTAHLSLEEVALDTFQDLVSWTLDALVAPGETKEAGLLHLLDLYYERWGARSRVHFARGVETAGAEGDLAAFCQAYLDADDDARKEVRALTLWSEGHELKNRQHVSGVRGTLNAHTAQRVLGDLSRILQVLGHGGLLLLLSLGDALSRRTDRQREKGYTVLRELVDNFDSFRGAVSFRIHLTGGDAFFFGRRSIRGLLPLLMRLELPSRAEPPPPHRTWSRLVREPYEYVHRTVRAPDVKKPAALRTLIRVSQGLPPTEGVVSMSVGHERIDRQVTALFQHAENAGSVFQVLSGQYGSGKTHLLLHLAERAFSQGHPVFWLNLERMNLDLGNPARHLNRILGQSVMPKRGRPSALDRAQVWTRTPSRRNALLTALDQVAETEGEEAAAARKALRLVLGTKDPAPLLEEFLSARDLIRKPGSGTYRQDAYRRFLLWAELLRRLDDAQGPVLLIDEAENLYTTGVPRPARRSALRSLSFYCGGALPGACVVLAMTPSAFEEMRAESAELMDEQSEVESTLPLEDVLLFKRRLQKLVPATVPPLSKQRRVELAERVRATHQSVRGVIDFPDWEEVVGRVVKEDSGPRVLIRHLTDQLESRWWAGG